MFRSARFLYPLLLSALVVTGSTSARAALRINEIMASNSSAVQDPQGDYDDWIELHNDGRDAVDAAGMYLSDDPEVPTKWRIPTNAGAANYFGSIQNSCLRRSSLSRLYRSCLLSYKPIKVTP